MLPGLAVAGVMVAFVVWSLGWIESARPRWFVLSLVGCIALGGMFQFFLEIAAPYSLQKWAVLHHGFRAAARLKFDDVSSVLQNHAVVAEELEPNHVSANPAGWIVIYRALLSFFDAHPRLAQAVWNLEPHEIAWALKQNFATPLPDQAAIALVALFSRLLAVAVGLPVAWLVCQRFGRPAALAACAMANLVPAVPLLAPAVDTVYPTFAALIVALSYYASERRSAPAAGAAGGLVAVGMFFSLCFLVVAGLCALMVALRAVTGHRPTTRSMLAAGGAWLTVVMLFAVALNHRAWESWSVNLVKNHEFNACCGCTYGVWVGVNLLELAVAMGIPATVFLLARILPLPSGEGRGEGASTGERSWRLPRGVDARIEGSPKGQQPMGDAHDARSASDRPHPSPLPEGEGTGESNDPKRVLGAHDVCSASDRPHPSPLPEGEGTGESNGPKRVLDAHDVCSAANRPHPNPLPEGEGTGEPSLRNSPNPLPLVAAWLAIVVCLDLSGTNLGEVSRLWLFLMPLGAALASEWLDAASRRGRAIIGSLLLLQAFNCSLLARELVLLWPTAPRQIQEQYLGKPGGKWASYRRLSDEEIERRRSETAK